MAGADFSACGGDPCCQKIRCSSGDEPAGPAWLGHVFDDGPQPTGLRYCMNGVAMRFKPAAA